MGLTAYTSAQGTPFSEAEQQALQSWFTELAVRFPGRLIARNIDRECERADIDRGIFDSFLRRVAWEWSRTPGNDPTRVMIDAHQSCTDLVPGLVIDVNDATMLVRCMRVDHLRKYHLSGLPLIGLPSDDPERAGEQQWDDWIIERLQAGAIEGRHLEMTTLGRPCAPVWVASRAELQSTPADAAPPAAPSDIGGAPLDNPARGNRAEQLATSLGLHHLSDCHLVELHYPVGVLRGAGLELKAPTVLDAVAAGDVSTVFVKRSGPGGPSWGHAANVSSWSHGASEAVHQPLPLTHLTSASLLLSYAGRLPPREPAIDFERLYQHT